MPTQFNFDGKIITIPGAYSTIKSGIKNPSLSLAFGNTLLIDTGISTGPGGLWGGGSGINGVLKNGGNAHYTFDNVRDLRTFVRGGVPYIIGDALFNPGGGATAGISSLTIIKAKTTVPATIAILFGAQEDSDSDANSGNDGSLTIKLRNEGFVGNGVLGDETRAKATVTITNAGAAGNEIALVIDGVTVASYTVLTGSTIAAVVAGLVADASARGIVTVFSNSATQIVIQAPRGYAGELNGSSITIQKTGSVNGSSGNFSGGVEGTLLTRGYAAKVVAGEDDEDKFIVKFYRGTYKGTDELVRIVGAPAHIDGISELSSPVEFLVESPEVSTVQELVTWMQDTAGDGFAFNQFFYLDDYRIGTTDEILSQDLSNNYIKAEGGEETFSTDDLSAALDSIEGLTFDFILADNWGDDARSPSNLAIHEWITNTANIKPDLYVGGGATVGEFNTGSAISSVELAKAFDSQYVTLAHAGAMDTDVGGRSLKEYDSIYKAAKLLGREAGLEPQVPLTFKNIGIRGESHVLTVKEQKIALKYGVLVTKPDGSNFEVLKGVNTLQNNTRLVNPDGTTASKQLARIIRQINKELVFNAKATLLKKKNGANRNTVSVEDVKAFTEAFLQERCATATTDDLLITFRQVTVVLNQDAYEITYGIEANTEVSFLFFTGFLLDPNS